MTETNMTDTEILDYLEKHMSLLCYTPLIPEGMINPYYSLSTRKGTGQKYYGCDFAPTIREIVRQSAELLRLSKECND